MFQSLRTLASLPKMGLLSWQLLRDPRVPSQPKVMAAGAILLILSPLDLLDWLPFAGGAGELALIALVLKAFVSAAPEDVRQEHMAALGISQI